jgi:hypothetical protein
LIGMMRMDGMVVVDEEDYAATELMLE